MHENSYDWTDPIQCTDINLDYSKGPAASWSMLIIDVVVDELCHWLNDKKYWSYINILVL